MEGTEVAIIEHRALEVRSLSPLDLPVATFQAALDRRRQNHKALIAWVREELVSGIDFGRIHVVKKERCPLGANCKNESHFSKPSLWKPGAEKICGMLAVTVDFPNLKDYEQAAVSGVAIENVILRCHLLNGQGDILSQGVGARSVLREGGDLNKALKMAEKSAHIDATLRLAGLSEVFTQDLEDMLLTLDASEREVVESESGEPQPGEQWGDIGPHKVVADQSCPCGSMVIERTTKKGMNQVTCELGYRVFLNQPGAVAKDKQLRAADPNLRHYHKVGR